MVGRFVQPVLLAAIMIAARASDLPPAHEILKRVQARMEAVCEDWPTNRFHYIQTNVVEEFDGSNKLKKRTVKTYEVQQIRGMPQSKLLVVDGRPLTAAEQRWR